MIDMIFGVWMLWQSASPAVPGKPLDAAQAKPAIAEAQDPDRPAISASDLKALRENNFFAPHTKRPVKPPYQPKDRNKPPVTPAKPKPPCVTGIFFDVKSQDYLVIVEDRNEGSLKFFKEPKFLKVGDEVLGVKLQSVTSEKAVFQKGEVSKEARVGDPMPETDAKPTSVAVPSDDSDLADDEDPTAAPAAAGAVLQKKETLKPDSKSTDTRPSDAVLEELRKKNGKMRKNRPGE